MSAVELILTALAAGAGVGVKDTAAAAVQDAYSDLRDALRRRVAAPQSGRVVEETDEVESGAEPTAAELVLSGAAEDEDVLLAARKFLELADPTGVVAGKYADLGLVASDRLRQGDNSVRITTSYGPVAGTMTGPVTVSYGERLPIPPLSPES